MPDLNRIVEELSQLTVMEAAELSKRLEAVWGVSAAPVVETVVPPVVVDVVEEKTEFEVILSSVTPDRKINVIKEVRAITGLGLKEAKEFVEAASATKVVKDSLSKVEADTLKRRLDEAGAQAVIH